MKLWVIALTVAVAAIILPSSTAGQNITAQSSRQKRFSIFSLVQFANTECTLASSTATSVMTGTCYTQSECTSNGGTGSGNCASGFGVCCMFTVSTCGSTVSKNTTYIQNQNFPNSYTTTGSCTYTFTANADICQIRLDFDNLVLTNPTAGGLCNTDSLKLSSASASGTLIPPVPGTLCGINTGNFLYFETARQTSAGNIQINIGAGAGANQIRTWKIKVTFIECGSPSRAPTDCTQYFTGPGGTFTSFNYNGGSGQMLQNLNYNICFRQELGYCSILYSENGAFANTNTGKAFSLDVTAATSIRGAGVATGQRCQSAGLIIPSVPSGQSANDPSEVYCGQYLNPLDAQKNSGFVTGSLAPFNIGVYTNNGLGANQNLGFNLQYEQVPC